MRATTIIGAATVALLVHRPAAALPTVIPSADVERRTAEARAKIAGHPAAARVDLLVDGPGAGQPNVYVFPRDAAASSELSLLVEPSCVEMQRAIDDVNALTDAVFALSDANLDRALAVARSRKLHLDFVALHKEPLRIAAEGAYRIRSLEAAVRSLAGVVAELDALIADGGGRTPPDPGLPELEARRADTADQLAARQAELAAARVDPTYTAAAVVAAEADALLDQVRDAQRSLADDSHRRGLDAALDAANAAKAAFNDLARVDAAIGEATFPLFDAAIVDLIVQRQRAGDRWFPGFIEDLAWQVPTGILFEAPPFTYRIYKRVGSLLIAIDSVLPPIAGTRPGTTTVEVLAGSQLQARQTAVGAGDDGQVRIRTTDLLRTTAPRVEVRLGLGTYCGQVDIEEITSSSAEADDVVATPTAQRYRLVPRSDRLLFAQTATASFETPVDGPEIRSRCSLHSDAYSAAVRSNPSPGELLFWNDVVQWDLTAPRRLADLGLVCDFPPEAVRHGEGVRREAEWISQLTVWETVAMFLEMAGAPSPEPVTETSPLVAAFLRLFPDPMAWSSALQRLCQDTPVCQLALADPAVFDEQCTTEADGNGGTVTRCWQQSQLTSFEFVRSGAYWQPGSLTSRIGFRLTAAP